VATFPSITPTYGTTQTVEQKSITTKMGDGYEFRTVFGLPANKRLHIVNLSFAISETDADTIDTFLNQASFDYTMTGESSARKFKCTSRSRSIPYLNRVNMNLTFEEVAEP
jgi:phage-related protein